MKHVGFPVLFPFPAVSVTVGKGVSQFVDFCGENGTEQLWELCA